MSDTNIGVSLPGDSRQAYNRVGESIPDDALVVRGGRNLASDIERKVGVHPSGVTGVSVVAAAGVPLIVLANDVPHNQIGVTTAGQIREAGGDVIRTSGRSRYHATLVGLTPLVAHSLLTPPITNPAKTQTDST